MYKLIWKGQTILKNWQMSSDDWEILFQMTFRIIFVNFFLNQSLSMVFCVTYHISQWLPLSCQTGCHLTSFYKNWKSLLLYHKSQSLLVTCGSLHIDFCMNVKNLFSSVIHILYPYNKKTNFSYSATCKNICYLLSVHRHRIVNYCQEYTGSPPMFFTSLSKTSWK